MRLVLMAIITVWSAAATASDTATLRGLDGKPHALSDYVGHGRWVMINVWSPGCSHCLVELPTLRRFHSDHNAAAMVVGIAVQYPGFGYPDSAAIASFAHANKINFPLLLADRDLASAFVTDLVDIIPLTFAFHPDGRMVARWHGVITTTDIEEIIRDFQ